MDQTSTNLSPPLSNEWIADASGRLGREAECLHRGNFYPYVVLWRKADLAVHLILVSVDAVPEEAT
jgi:hypothetical protein